MMKIFMILMTISISTLAGHYIDIIDSNGDTHTCYVYDDGTVDCS